MKQRGVHLLPDDAPLTSSIADTVGALIAQGHGAWDWGHGNDLLESDDILAQNPAAYRLGLEPVLLDIAEDYLSEPCFYMGCSLKRERVSPSNAGTRQWHHDIEDDRMLRLIFYLNPVQEGGGPFQYIDAARSRAAHAALGYRSGYLSDAAMQPAVPCDDWVSVQGAAGMMIAFDGTRVFHRATRPLADDRFSLSITYSSRYPRQILRQVRLRTASRRKLVASLTERQRACLPRGRWN
ncbi:MAG TPA: hypothetical protein VM900_02520 [Sphingomonas sp.]|nr:hypothetical protein [Sphingomonas sp.]